MCNVERVTQNVYSPSMHRRGRDHSNNKRGGPHHDIICGARSAVDCAT